MWNRWWNQLRLTWEMGVGSNRREVAAVVSSLQKSMKKRIRPPLSASDKELVSHIRRETEHSNRDNLRRTQAYLDIYHRFPEIHWALLAHCVSRNGGWAMTDVQGEWFLHIASTTDSSRFFAYLERANWLIFQDAYPQLLLYQEGKQVHRDLTHLLHDFGVSGFMQWTWQRFWQTGNSALLTRALIINEQNYIEPRVVQSPSFQSTVASSIQYQLQSFLNLNQVLLPYQKGSQVRLAGTTMQEFGSVDDRIQTGLRLYQTLFQDRLLHQAIVRFMCDVPHTGSRADFWPDVFTTTRPSTFSTPYRSRFFGTADPGRKIYSPKLEAVWPPVEHPPAEPGDWFQDLRHVVYLFDETPRQPSDITDEYVQSIRTIEALIIAKDTAKAVIPGG